MYIAMDMKSRAYDMTGRQQAKSATRDGIIRGGIDGEPDLSLQHSGK